METTYEFQGSTRLAVTAIGLVLLASVASVGVGPNALGIAALVVHLSAFIGGWWLIYRAYSVMEGIERQSFRHASAVTALVTFVVLVIGSDALRVLNLSVDSRITLPAVWAGMVVVHTASLKRAMRQAP